MVNPLEQPAPGDKMKRIRDFARDLAYGELQEHWGPGIQTSNGHQQIREQYNGDRLDEYISLKWGNVYPNLRFLIKLGYLSVSNEKAVSVTEKAYTLLEEKLQSVFISYHRKTSSALALYIWSELLRNKYDCFLDVHNLNVGDAWRSHLQIAVHNSTVFIPVLGVKSLGSQAVVDELEWALEDEKKTIIPILHTGLEPKQLSGTKFEPLKHKHLITIDEEVSSEFASKISQLLMALDIL